MIRESELAKAVAERLADKTTYADVDNDIVNGSLEEVIDAVIAVLDAHGPIIYGE